MKPAWSFRLRPPKRDLEPPIAVSPSLELPPALQAGALSAMQFTRQQVGIPDGAVLELTGIGAHTPENTMQFAAEVEAAVREFYSQKYQ